ncbi:MAG: hypothetical protein R6U95_00785 [Bacteroidales bacterium]
MMQEKQQTYYSALSHRGFDMHTILSAVESGEYSIDLVVSVALSDQQPQARYSSWIISHYLMRSNSIDAYVNAAINFLYNTEFKHTGHLREILRWFSYIPIHKHYNIGALVHVCFAVLSDMTMPTGVKCHAMNILEKVVKSEPELIPEFVAVLHDIEPYMTRSGARKIKKLLAKLRLMQEKHIL